VGYEPSVSIGKYQQVTRTIAGAADHFQLISIQDEWLHATATDREIETLVTLRGSKQINNSLLLMLVHRD
jgi:hypothetical protein